MKRESIPTQMNRDNLIQSALIVHIWRWKHNHELWSSFFNALKNYECHDDIDSHNDSEEETAEFLFY